MSRSIDYRETEGKDITHHEKKLILGELNNLLLSKDFINSPQSSKFLAYVVHETLAGRQDRIKSYSIGIDVLKKPIDFDPESDPAVRAIAWRIRKKIAAHYKCRTPEVKITIPLRRYVPHFEINRG